MTKPSLLQIQSSKHRQLQIKTLSRQDHEQPQPFKWKSPLFSSYDKKQRCPYDPFTIVISCYNKTMSRRPWFEECQVEDRSNIFMPLDIESPLHHPTLIVETREVQTASCGRQRDTIKSFKENKTQEGQGQKGQKVPTKSNPQQININMNKVTNRSKARRGKNRQTTNLSKFIFGIVNKLIEVGYLTHKLSKEEEQAYRQFIKERGNLKSYQMLLRFSTFRRTMLNLVESSLIARKILLAQRMKMANKLIVFKFLENIRSICYSSVKRWKTC